MKTIYKDIYALTDDCLETWPKVDQTKWPIRFYEPWSSILHHESYPQDFDDEFQDIGNDF